jgi:aminoglycoside phosphotransferase (APT) family kinase protein
VKFHSAATESVTVPVHGDFRDGQLLVAGGHLGALIDVDTAGPGERADEWARLLGHLSGPGLHNYGTAVLVYAERHTDPDDLGVQTAAADRGPPGSDPAAASAYER